MLNLPKVATRNPGPRCLAMVEFAEYRLADPATGSERRIVQPRLIARTTTIDRFVIRSEVPGIAIDTEANLNAAALARERAAGGSERHAAWRSFLEAFLAEVAFDDPAQFRRAAAATTGWACPSPVLPMPRVSTSTLR